MELIKLENDVITAISVGNDEETKLVKEYAMAAGIIAYNTNRESKYEYKILLDKLVEIVIIDYTALKAALNNINNYLNRQNKKITYSVNGLEGVLEHYKDIPLEVFELTNKHWMLFKNVQYSVNCYLDEVFGGN